MNETMNEEMDEFTLREINLLRVMVRSSYALQAQRVQMGLRICAYFRNKISTNIEEGEKDADELDGKQIRMIVQLKNEYKILISVLNKNFRSLPTHMNYDKCELISCRSEAVLIEQYVGLERLEYRDFQALERQLELIPIYETYLSSIIGIGPAMAAILITSFDPYKALSSSNFWAFTGLDVAPDGWGRSWRKEHLIEREYIDKSGQKKTRMSVTYDPWLKSKMVGVLAGCFLRSKSAWARVYYDYKKRLEDDPRRIKIGVEEWKKLRKTEEPDFDLKPYWTPGRIDRASKRYMVKKFLHQFWRRWRELEGLPTYKPMKEDAEHDAGTTVSLPIS